MTAFARKTDPQTSWDAALDIPDAEIRNSEQAVLSMFRRRGPMTLDELEIAMRAEYPGRWSDQRIRTAQCKLRRRGLLEEQGIRKPPIGRKRMIIGAVKGDDVGKDQRNQTRNIH